MAVHEPDRQDGARAPSAQSLRDDETAGDPRASRAAAGEDEEPSLPLGPERAAARRPRKNGGVGLHVQGKYRLVQSAERRRPRRTRRWLLLSQRDRIAPVRNARELPDARARTAPGEYPDHAQTRTLAEAG